MRTTTTTLALLAGLAATPATLALHAVATRLVAATGDPAPGAEPGVTLGFLTAPLNHSLMTPTINDQDLVAFAAILLGPPVTISNQNAFFAESNAALTMRVRDEQASPIPNIPIDELQNIDRVPLSPDFTAQSTLFSATLDDASVPAFDRFAIFRHTPSLGLEIIARETQQAPSLPAGVVFDDLVGAAQNDSLTTLFHSNLRGPGVTSSNNDALFTLRNNALSLFLREADPAPLLANLAISKPASNPRTFLLATLNDRSDILVHTGLSGPSVSSSNDEIIYVFTDAGPSIVVREGDPAPGIPNGFFGGGASISTFTFPSLSNNGRVAFSARAGSVISTVYSNRSGSLQPIALTGQQAPGFPSPHTFFAFSTPTINARGDVIFIAFASPTGSPINSRQAIYLDDGASLTPVLVAGGPAPDAPPGATIHESSPFASRAINDNGRLAIIANIVTPSSSFETTLYISDHQRNLKRVVAVGDTLSVRGQDSTVVRIVPGRFNHNNALVYRLDFTDNSSAIFVSRVAIPGDANQDNVVNFADLNLVLSSFGATGIALPADLNLDNVVNFADLNLVLSNFGASN